MRAIHYAVRYRYIYICIRVIPTAKLRSLGRGKWDFPVKYTRSFPPWVTSRDGRRNASNFETDRLGNFLATDRLVSSLQSHLSFSCKQISPEVGAPRKLDGKVWKLKFDWLLTKKGRGINERKTTRLKCLLLRPTFSNANLLSNTCEVLWRVIFKPAYFSIEWNYETKT